MSLQSLHQRPHQNASTDRYRLSLRSLQNYQKPISSALLSRPALLFLLALLVIIGVLFPYIQAPFSFLSFNSRSNLKWHAYTLPDAAARVAKDNTLIVCAVSEAYLPFLNNWLISISRQRQQDKVLVIAEDYFTLYKGFFNFTARRPRHLLQILELGYNVMYNDVDMVWLADPFPYLKGEHDVYFTDDMAYVKPLNHSHELPPPGKKGRTYICSCMIYLRPTGGAKLVMKKWIEELQAQPWSKVKKANDQPAFNWALTKTTDQVDFYLLPQQAFPTGGLYFKNKTWVQETKGMHVIIHNNYIVGFEKKIKRFQDNGLWLVDDHASESPLGRL